MSIYHIYNKSISKFVIYNSEEEFNRFFSVFRYYQVEKPRIKFSHYLGRSEKFKGKVLIPSMKSANKLVDIVAYCIMPTHYHFVLCELMPGGISKYINNISNSYTRYFNLRHNRKGPLWTSRYGRKYLETIEDVYYLTRYCHRNPMKARLVSSPADWQYSSYNEFLFNSEQKVCNFDEYLDIDPIEYREYVIDIRYDRKETTTTA